MLSIWRVVTLLNRLGTELIDWIIKNLPIRTREEACEYGMKLLTARFIYNVSRKKKFKDSDNLYKFGVSIYYVTSFKHSNY